MSNTFSKLITDYFSEYLPLTRGMSKNTIISYKYTFIQLIEYMKKYKNISSSKLQISDFNNKTIEAFLIYLENEKGISVSSRNQKLAAIHSFFSYVSKRDLTNFNLCNEILMIKFKKKGNTAITYLTLDEIRILLAIPNIKQKVGLRDLSLLSLMYDSGARVQEIIDLKVKNIDLGYFPSVQLYGKGGKTRIIPLSKDIRDIIKKYITYNNLSSEDIMFKNKYSTKFTRVGIQYIINKYIKLAREKYPDKFKGKIHNHSFRHSKAMHLLEAGVNLIYIRDFLGHVSITTTEIYAKANPEVKRKILEENAQSLNLKSNYTKKEKNELLNWLKQSL